MTKNPWILVAKIAAFTLMAADIVIMAVCLKKQGDEKRRIKDNYEAEVRRDMARQQTIDVAELKKYFADEVETLKKFGIKPRNVENIVEVAYVYRDTTVYRDTLIYIYDTVRSAKTADFCVQTGCFNIDGQIVGDTLEIRDIAAYDEITVALYREKRKCLFERQKVKAIAISGCSGDTLAVLRNLNVENAWQK